MSCKSEDLIPVSSNNIHRLPRKPRKVTLANDKIQKLTGTEFGDWRIGVNKFVKQINER